MDVSTEMSHTKPQLAVTNRRQLEKAQTGNSVLSGEFTPLTSKDGPLKSSKDCSKRSTDSMSTQKRKYWQPKKGSKTYYLNSESQLECREDPKDVTSELDKKQLPLSRLKSVYHEPRGMLIKDSEHLKWLYPNSFDRLGSLKGQYHIKIDPNVAPVAQARRKVLIESREAIEDERRASYLMARNWQVQHLYTGKAIHHEVRPQGT